MRKQFAAIAKLIADKRRSNIWNRVVCVLASFVVFCTTYALILPALTMQVTKASASITLMNEFVSIVNVLPDSLENTDESVEYNMSLALDKYSEAENTYLEENPDGSFETFVATSKVYSSAVNKLKSLYGISTYALLPNPDNYPVPEGEYIIMNRWMYASDPHKNQTNYPDALKDPNTATNYTLQRDHALRSEQPAWDGYTKNTLILSRSVDVIAGADTNSYNVLQIADNNAGNDVGKWYFEPRVDSDGSIYYYISTILSGERQYIHIESTYKDGAVVTSGTAGKLYLSPTINDNWAKLYITRATKNFDNHNQYFSADGSSYPVNQLGDQIVYRIANKDGYAINKANNETFQCYANAQSSPNDWCHLAQYNGPIIEDGEYAIVNRLIPFTKTDLRYDLALNATASYWGTTDPIHCLRHNVVSISGYIDKGRGIAGIPADALTDNNTWKFESVRDSNGTLKYYLISTEANGEKQYLKISSTINADSRFNLYLTTDSNDPDTHIEINKKIIKVTSTDNPKIADGTELVQYIFRNTAGYTLEKNFSDYFQSNAAIRENYAYMTLCKPINTMDEGTYAILNTNFKTSVGGVPSDKWFALSSYAPSWRVTQNDLFSLYGASLDICDTTDTADSTYDALAQETGIYKTRGYSSPFDNYTNSFWKFEPQDENGDGACDYYYITSVNRGDNIDETSDDKVVYLSIRNKSVLNLESRKNAAEGRGIQVLETPDDSCKILISTSKKKNLSGKEITQFTFSNLNGYSLYKNFNEEYTNYSTLTDDRSYQSLAKVIHFLPNGYYSIVNRNITESFGTNNDGIGKKDFAMLGTSPSWATGALSRVKVDVEADSYEPDFGFHRLVNNTASTMWFFGPVHGDDGAVLGHRISADIDGGMKYLAINTTADSTDGGARGLQLVDTPNEYTTLCVSAEYGPNHEIQWRITNKDGVSLQKANNEVFLNYYGFFGSGEKHSEYAAECMTLCKSVSKMEPITNDTKLDATVKVFNYNETFNHVGPGVLSTSPFTYNQGSFYAWHGIDGYIHPKYVAFDGGGHPAGTGHPHMYSKLVDGMPFVSHLFHPYDANYKVFDPLGEFGYSVKRGVIEVDSNGVPYNYKNGSLSPFFGEEAVTNRFLKGLMNDGGGLFQKDDAGFYYYDSSQNAAWFDATNGRFVLYDGVVAPSYKSLEPYHTYPNNNYYNFFPFNSVGNYGDVETAAVATQNGNVESYYTLVDDTDLWFGMTVEFDFYMTEDGRVADEHGVMHDMEFDFVGDDDVFVFLDDYLVIDIGGSHGALHGYIDFATGEVIDTPRITDEEADKALKYTNFIDAYNQGRPTWDTDFSSTLTGSTERKRTLASILKDSGIELDGDTLAPYTKHTLKFFYMERGGHISYCRLRFNMPTIPDSDLTVEKVIPDDGTVNDSLIGTAEHTYRVVTTDANGNPTNDPYVMPNSQYELRDKEYNVVTGPFYTDKNGLFKLKAEYSASFHELLDKYADTHGSHVPVYGYAVQELIPAEIIEYYKVSVANGGDFSEINRGEKITIDGVEYYIFNTDEFHPSETPYIEFKNEPSDTASLMITKLNAESSLLSKDTVFDINVQLSNAGIPVGTPYKLYDLDDAGNVTATTDKTVETTGIIPLKINQSAEIDGILATTTFAVWEKPHSNNPYYQTQYSGTFTDKTATVNIAPDSNGKMSGRFLAGDRAEITVTNASYDFPATFDIRKICLANEANNQKQFSFNAVRGEFDTATGEFTPYNGIVSGATVTVTGDTAYTAMMTVGCLQSNGETQYFKITEARSSDFDGYIYDDTFYIIAVTCDENGATVTAVYKNGSTNDALTASGGKFTLDFENRRATKLSISKLVTGISNSTQAFNFNAAITLNGNPYIINSGTDYTVETDGTVSFALKSGEEVSLPYIPVGATVVITELNNDGYATTFTAGNTESDGDSITLSLDSSDYVNVTCTNQTTYRLPDSGGIGTNIFTMLAIMLIVVSGLLLTVQMFRRRRNSF